MGVKPRFVAEHDGARRWCAGRSERLIGLFGWRHLIPTLKDEVIIIPIRASVNVICKAAVGLSRILDHSRPSTNWPKGTSG